MDANKSEQGSLFNPNALPEVPLDPSLILAGDVPGLLYHHLSTEIGIGDEKIVHLGDEWKRQQKLRLVNPELKMTGFAGAIALHESLERTGKRSHFYLWDHSSSDWDTHDCVFEVSGGPVDTGGWSAVGGNHIWEKVSLHTRYNSGVLGTSKALKVVAFICYFVARITETPRYQGRRYYEEDFLKDMTDWSPAR